MATNNALMTEIKCMNLQFFREFLIKSGNFGHSLICKTFEFRPEKRKSSLISVPLFGPTTVPKMTGKRPLYVRALTIRSS